MATLTQLTSNIRTDLTIDPNGDIWSDATIQRFVNRYVGKVSSMLNLDFDEVTGSFTLVASTATYDLSAELSNYDKLQSLRLDGKTFLLDEVHLPEFQDGRDLTTEGEPKYFYFYGDKTIGLWPVPDGNITTMHARFERNAATLTANDSPPWPDRWHYICELYAIWKCFESIPGHEEKAERARQIFVAAEREMKRDIWRRDNNGLNWRLPQEEYVIPLRERAN